MERQIEKRISLSNEELFEIIYHNYELLKKPNELIQFYFKIINELKAIEDKHKALISFGFTEDEKQKLNGDWLNKIKQIKNNDGAKNLILLHYYLSLNGYALRYHKACTASDRAHIDNEWQRENQTDIDDAKKAMKKATYNIDYITEIGNCINSALKLVSSSNISDAEKLFYKVHLLALVKKTIELYNLLLKDDSRFEEGIKENIKLAEKIIKEPLANIDFDVSSLNKIMHEVGFHKETETVLIQKEKKQPAILSNSSIFFQNNVPTIDIKPIKDAISEYIHIDKYDKDSSDKSVKRAQGYLICLNQCSSENPLRAILLVYTLLNDKHTFYGENLNNKVNAVVSEDFLQMAAQYLIGKFKTTDNLKNASKLLVEIIMDDERRIESDCAAETKAHPLEMDFIKICNDQPLQRRENCLIQ